MWFLKAEEALRGHKDSEHYVKYQSFTTLELRNMFGLAICLRKLGNHFESLDVLRSMLPKIEYLLKINSQEDNDLESLLAAKLSPNSPRKLRKSNTTVFFPTISVKKQAQQTKCIKLATLVFMNLSRTLECMNKYYHSEVTARTALHCAEDCMLPESDEFSELLASYYSFVAGKVISV